VTRENLNAVVTPFDLHDSYFPHFRAAVTPVAQGGGGAVGVMMAMNAVPPPPPHPPKYYIKATQPPKRAQR
jgi:hypothetical protein